MLPQLPASQANAASCESVADWWPRHRAIASEHVDPIHQAIIGGFVADRVGWAFASGYQAALRALFPEAPADRICALCVTEADGNSPKAIKSTLMKNGDGWILNGTSAGRRWDPKARYFSSQRATRPRQRREPRYESRKLIQRPGD